MDPDRDRIDALLVYRGLGIEGIVGSGEKRASSQLDQLRKGDRVFAIGEQARLIHLDEASDAQSPVLALLRSKTAVENGRFFREPGGRLCGWQLVRVDGLTSVLEAANESFRAKLATESAAKSFRREHHLEDDAGGALLRKALAAKHDFFVRRGRALAYRWPTTAEGRVAYLAKLGDERARGERRPLIELFAENGISLTWTAEATEVALGDSSKVEQRFVVPSRGGTEKAGDLAPLLEAKGFKIHDDVTDATIAKEFAAFCAR